MSNPTLKVCPEQTRELIMDWLIPLTENGSMDEVFHAFVDELKPLAVAAAERAVNRKMRNCSSEAALQRMKGFLRRLHSTLESVLLNPDMVAVATDSEADLYAAIIETGDWIRFLDCNPSPSEPAKEGAK